MKNVMTGTYIHNDKTYNFNFGTDLSIADKQKFVNSVVNLVVIDDSYNSIIRDLVFDFYTIDFFTDIDISEFEESSFFLDDVERFLDETNIIDIVKANASPATFKELNKAVDLNIEYCTGIHPNPMNEAIASLLNTIEKKINEVDLDSMMGMAQKFAGMTEDFTLENAMKVYMNSDVHKQNLAEIEEAKKDKAE